MGTIPFNFARKDVETAAAGNMLGSGFGQEVARGQAAMGQAIQGAAGMAAGMTLHEMDRRRKLAVAGDLTYSHTNLMAIRHRAAQAASQVSDPADVDRIRADAEGKAADLRKQLRRSESLAEFDNALMGWRTEFGAEMERRKVQIDIDDQTAKAQTAISQAVQYGDLASLDGAVSALADAQNWTGGERTKYLAEQQHALSLTAKRTATAQFGNAQFTDPAELDQHAATLKERINAGVDSQFRYLTDEDKADAVAMVDRLAKGMKNDQNAAKDKALADQADAVGASMERFDQAVKRNDSPAIAGMKPTLMQDIADAEKAKALTRTRAEQWRGMIEAHVATVDDHGSLRSVRALKFGWENGDIPSEAAQAALVRHFDGGPRTSEMARELYLEIEQARKTGQAKEQNATVKAGHDAIEFYSGVGLLGNRRFVVEGEGEKAKVKDVTDSLRQAELSAAEAVALASMRNRTESEQRKISAQVRATLAAKWGRQDAAYNRLNDEFKVWFSKNPNASPAEARQWVRDLVGTTPFAALAQLALQSWGVEIPPAVTAGASAASQAGGVDIYETSIFPQDNPWPSPRK